MLSSQIFYLKEEKKHLKKKPVKYISTRILYNVLQLNRFINVFENKRKYHHHAPKSNLIINNTFSKRSLTSHQQNITIQFFIFFYITLHLCEEKKLYHCVLF
jgi:hypothetical protein